MSQFSDAGAAEDDVDAEIDYYASLSPEAVDAELRRLGIDPEPTIAAVTALVQERLGEWHGRSEKH